MKKHLRLPPPRYTLPFLILLLVLGSCSFDPPRPQAPLQEQKALASQAISAANNEFLGSIASGTASRSLGGASEQEKIDLRNKLIGLAWMAYYTGDTEELMKVIVDNGLQQKLLDVVSKYSVDENQKTMNEPSEFMLGLRGSGTSRSVGTSFFSQLADGTALVCYGNGSSSSISFLSAIIPGTWKHSGMVDNLRKWDLDSAILSASNQTTHGFAVGYETKNKWAAESAVQARGIQGSNPSNSRAALDYGRQFLGRNFNFATTRDADDNWYCSKVVYRSWLSQGINLEPTPWPWDPWVTPQDIHDDNDTYYAGGDLDPPPPPPPPPLERG